MPPRKGGEEMRDVLVPLGVEAAPVGETQEIADTTDTKLFSTQ